MASGGSGSEAAVADIFEVFKIARTPLEQLTALPLETLQKKFTILSPITSTAQLGKGSVALATLPAPGHIVVDQEKFKEMFATKAKEAAVQQSTVILNQTDAAIENLKAEFEEEVKTIITMVRETIATEQGKTLESMAKLSNDTTKSGSEKFTEAQAIVEKQNQMIEKVLELLAHKDFHSPTHVTHEIVEKGEQK